MITKFDAVRELYPNAVSVKADDNFYDSDNNIITIDEDAVETKLTELKNANQYKDDRRLEYPDISDQLDDLFHAGAFSTEMTATIQAVKDKYPKE